MLTTIGFIAVMFVGMVGVISFVYSAYRVIDFIITKILGV